jgi:DNA repair photolyase
LVNEINAKTLLNKSKRGDKWFLANYTLNPYAGCSLACIYCYTLGSKYGGNYGVDLAVKSNAVPILKKQLKNTIKKNQRGFILLGSAADPYPAVEKELNLTREILGLIKRYKFPIHILTKSKLIIRDMDIINTIKEAAILPTLLNDQLENGVIISFSFSTMNEKLAKIIEPGAPSPTERLEIMKEYSDAGFKTGIINMPVLPFISDTDDEIEVMIKTAKNYEAHYVLFAGLTLFGDGPNDCKTQYQNFLKENHPELLLKYKKLYNGSFAPSKRYQNDLGIRFRKISSKYDIKNRII